MYTSDSFHHFNYIFECTFGIWTVLCWCAVKHTKTNQKQRSQIHDSQKMWSYWTTSMSSKTIRTSFQTDLSLLRFIVIKRQKTASMTHHIYNSNVKCSALSDFDTVANAIHTMPCSHVTSTVDTSSNMAVNCWQAGWNAPRWSFNKSIRLSDFKTTKNPCATKIIIITQYNQKFCGPLRTKITKNHWLQFSVDFWQCAHESLAWIKG